MRRVEDWALVPATEMAALYGAERARWRADLDWDTADTCAALECARGDGRVPGLVVRLVNGAIDGWTYFLLHGSELQIGALVASSPETTALLLDAVLAAPAAAVARRTLFFAYTGAPSVETALAQRGFDVGAEYYLVRALDGRTVSIDPHGAPGPHGPIGPGGPDGPQCPNRPYGPHDRHDLGETSLRVWRDVDVEPVAEVLRAAYHGPDPRRAFVASGALPDWRVYVRQLTLTSGCGSFVPAASVVAVNGDRVDGAALVTRVSDTTAHLAQIAVRPTCRGHGLGARLLAQVVAAAAAGGFPRLSLIVSDANVRARRVYADKGFTMQGAFVSATRARRRSAGHSGAPAA